MKLNLLNNNLFTVNKSYHESFKSLNTEELKGLCEHNSLLKKVHEELQSNVTQSDLEDFDNFFEKN